MSKHADLFALWDEFETTDDPEAIEALAMRLFVTGYGRLTTARDRGESPTWEDVALARLVGIASVNLEAYEDGDFRLIEIGDDLTRKNPIRMNLARGERGEWRKKRAKEMFAEIGAPKPTAEICKKIADDISQEENDDDTESKPVKPRTVRLYLTGH